MAPNPSPSTTTDEMWRLWEERPNKAWKLGGIFANKKAYHNTVINNLKNWPGNYSIKLALDLVDYNRDKARAIDLTMTDSEMVLWTTRMRESALDPVDDRLSAVREFYGTLDGKTVYGLIKDDEDGPWERSSADLTHLWHGHMSIFTAFVANWKKLAPILSVWSGQSYMEWRLSTMMLPKQGDSGEAVKYWQYVHNTVCKSVEPDAPALKVDGDYGPLMNTALTDFWKKSGGSATFKATYLPGWLAHKYHVALAKVVNPHPPVTPVVEEEQVRAMVNEWLAENIKINALDVEGHFTGKVSL
jgi:hypothetical protein